MTTAQPNHTLPLWVRDPTTRRATLTNGRKQLLTWIGDLPIAGPKWALFYVARVFIGLSRITRDFSRWIADQDSADLQQGHAWNEETDGYAKVHPIRRSHLQARALVAAAVLVVVGGPVLLLLAPQVLAAVVAVLLAAAMVKAIPGRGLHELLMAAALGAVVWWVGGRWLATLAVPRWAWWVFYGLVALGVVLLERRGRPEKKPGDAAVRLSGGAPSVKLDVIRDALCTLGIAGMKDPETISAVQMPHRDGAGVRVEVQLPPGVEAVVVMARAGKLASAIRREEKCVHLSKGRRNAGHLIVYIADAPMAEQDQGPWALDGTKPLSLFKQFPVGTNITGRWVYLCLAYGNLVVGAVPRVGKTVFLRMCALALAHDLRSKLYTFDGKGTGDFRPLEPIAHFHSRGDDPEEIQRVLGTLRELRDDMRKRAAIVGNLPLDECPGSKINDELADRLGFEPVVVVIDETQVYFAYGSKNNKAHKAIREELADIVEDLVRRGPALAYIVLMATQSVDDTTIPRGISLNAVVRFALKLFDSTANNKVLGDGAHGKGVSTVDFDREDIAVGILRGDGAEPDTIRGVWGLDSAPRVREIAQRLAALRRAAGRLTGQAAGEDVEPEPTVNFMEYVAEIVVVQERRNVSLQWLRDELAEMQPDTWGTLTVDALGAQLREAGVEVDSIWCPIEGKPMRGVKPEWVEAAAVDEEAEDDNESPAEDEAASPHLTEAGTHGLALNARIPGGSLLPHCR